MLKNFKRVVNFAVKDFGRNKGVSLAGIFVLTVAILLVTGLFFFQGIASYLTSEVQNKIDITAYFKAGTQESDILAAKTEITNMSTDIKKVDYISQEQALADFNQKHGGDKVFTQALSQVGDNPFLPSLNITTDGDPVQYQKIADAIQNADFAKLLDKVDFSEKKDTIEKVYSITTGINRFGIGLGLVLVILAIVVVFNTIKLAVDNSKEEISTMRIVGASDWFVRGPFVVQGIIYGLIAFIICFILSGVSAFFFTPKLSVIMPGFSMSDYFLLNWWIFVLIQAGFGVGVGVISSFIVVRKYLDI